MTFRDIVAMKQTEVEMLAPGKPVVVSRGSFIAAVLSGRPGLIAEVKPKSPSRGRLLERGQVARVVEIYDRHAQAVSVLCDRHFFDGGFDLLRQVAGLTRRPLLAKDFIISRKQIDLALMNGASAILLIAAILDRPTLVAYARYAVSYGLDVLIEVHGEDDPAGAAAAYEELDEQERERVLLGINNRDLETLRTDLAVTERLAPGLRTLMPNCRALVSESGIATRQDISRLAGLVDGFLVGSSLLEAEDPEARLRELVDRQEDRRGKLETDAGRRPLSANSGEEVNR